MKYLKTYEKIISFKDPMVINHPLVDFSIELEKILKIVQNVDNYNGTEIRKYFNSNDIYNVIDITICYKDHGSNRFKFNIEYINSTVHMIIRYADYFTNNKNSKFLFNFIKENFKSYILDHIHQLNSDSTVLTLSFSKSKINSIVTRLQKIKTEFSAIKYNL